MEVKREAFTDDYLFSTDKSLLDVVYIHKFLSGKSYWALGIPVHVVQKSIDNSLCIGVYKDSRQVGFARVITDYITFGYLADVFIDEEQRGKGLSKKLMTFIQTFEELKMFRRLVLATRDAHGLYAQFGFRPLKTPESFMEIHNPDVYKTLHSPNQLQ